MIASDSVISGSFLHAAGGALPQMREDIGIMVQYVLYHAPVASQESVELHGACLLLECG